MGEMIRAFQMIGLAGATALFVMLIGCPAATAGPFTGKNGRIAVVKSRGDTDYLGVYSKKRKFRTLYKSVYSDPYDSDHGRTGGQPVRGSPRRHPPAASDHRQS